MTEKELLEQILAKVTNTDNRLSKVEIDVSDLKSDVSGLKSDVSELRSDTSTLKSDVFTLKSDTSEIKQTVNKNYALTEEFYINQKEANTEVKDRIKVITGELEMHNEQISRNTADIKLYK